VLQPNGSNAGKALAAAAMPYDAVYLFGYVVEMALKAVVLARTPHGDWGSVRDDEFAGRRGHSFDRLRQLLSNRRQHFPKRVLEAVREASSAWTPQMRYRAGGGDPDLATRMAAAAQLVLGWAQENVF
jgi:hypothetical protein